MPKRDSYAEAGRTHREALARAVKVADDLKPRDWRVLCACFALVASYSRVEDRVYVEQLAVLSGVSRGRVSESLRRLHDLGVVEWRPTSARSGSRLNLGMRF